MKGAALLPGLPGRNWKLTDLYRYFFNEDQPHPHNALCDALATAKCFFRERELLHVPPDYFYRQNPVILYDRYRYNTKRIGIVLVVFICLLLVIFFLSFR